MIQNRVISESLSKPVMNRTYLDVFSFYVPYRLVWDYWPEYIAGGEDEQVPRMVGGANTYFQSLLKANATTVGDFNDFSRRTYNLVWNKFFRDNTVNEVDLTSTALQKAPLRATTFNQRLRTAIELADQTIDTSGATTSTGAIREAFSQDRFNKTRAFYGNKYTDYLAALGVEASWSILDEPELIGKSNQPLNFVMTDSTSEIPTPADPTDPSYVASMGGKWQGTAKHSIKRTFAPEHGLVMTMGVVRMDIEYANSNGLITNSKVQRDQWYSPEFETERKQEWFAYTDVLGTTQQTLYTEKYDDLRVGQNLIDRTDARNGTWVDASALDNLNPELIRYPDVQAAVDPFLNDQYAGITFNHVTTQRMQRISPVRPAQSVHGVA